MITWMENNDGSETHRNGHTRRLWQGDKVETITVKEPDISRHGIRCLFVIRPLTLDVGIRLRNVKKRPGGSYE